MERCCVCNGTLSTGDASGVCAKCRNGASTTAVVAGYEQKLRLLHAEIKNLTERNRILSEALLKYEWHPTADSSTLIISSNPELPTK